MDVLWKIVFAIPLVGGAALWAAFMVCENILEGIDLRHDHELFQRKLELILGDSDEM